MKKAIIGCGLIKKDIVGLMDKIDYEYKEFWMDPNYHNFPEKLKEAIIREIEAIDETNEKVPTYDEIILTFGLCGQALLGISSRTAIVTFIKGDDCIFADLHSRDDYKELRSSCIFSSNGWLSSRGNILDEYNAMSEKYGEKRAKRMYIALYKNYKHICYMKLENDIIEEDKEKLKDMEQVTGLDTIVRDGSLDLYEDLLYGRRNEFIKTIRPGEKTTLKDFM